jgi:hypothetical protein
MKRMNAVKKAMFALGVAATLGFGATQAFASPGQARAAGQCFPECYDQCGEAMGTKLRNGVCICCAVDR